jgi:hypothetical protein
VKYSWEVIALPMEALPREGSGDFGTSPFYGQHSVLLTWGAERDAQEGFAKDSQRNGLRQLRESSF